MTGRPKKLVIGIDYGTTNSGVAYAIVPDNNKSDDVDITVIREWSHGVREENLPSDIAYDSKGNPVGYAFDLPDDAQSTIQWVKVLLEPAELGHNRPGTDKVWQTMHDLDQLGKSPVDVIADYLRWLWVQVERSLEETGNDVDAEEVVVVITVPASWSHRANASMRIAAQKAGIDSNGRVLKFRVEPEAAALFELKLRAKRGQVAKGDCFIVCDAGGGTVDLVSFQVRSVEPLSLDQVVVSKGDFCGSAFINAAFETQLKVFLGKDWDRLSNEAKTRIRQYFEQTIKRRYSPENPGEWTIPAPGLEDDEKRGIKDGRLRLKDAILQVSFEEIMTQTRMLIDDQKDELKKNNLLQHLRAILLVGGFGASKYLVARLQQGYPDNERVRVVRGSHSWTAVVQGAVQCEVVNRDIYAPVNQRLSNYHYGIPYQRGDLKKVCWLIHKGQDVRDSSRIEKYMLRLEDRPWLDERDTATICVQLVKTDKDVVTEDEDSSLQPHVDIYCQVPTAIRHSPEAKCISDNPRVWQIPAELILAMDGPLLTAKCKVQGKDVGLLDLKYRDDVDFPSHGLTAVQSMVEPEELRTVSRTSTSGAVESILPRPKDTNRASSATVDSVLSFGGRNSDHPGMLSRPGSSGSPILAARTFSAGPSDRPGMPSSSSPTPAVRTSTISTLGHATLPPRQNSAASPTPTPRTSTIGPSDPPRQNSSTGSPPLQVTRTSTIGNLFRRKSSKSEADYEAERLKKEEKAKRDEERRREKERRRQEQEQERVLAQQRPREQGDLWIDVINPMTGEHMLQNQYTGEMEVAPSQQASGLGLRGF